MTLTSNQITNAERYEYLIELAQTDMHTAIELFKTDARCTPAKSNE